MTTSNKTSQEYGIISKAFKKENQLRLAIPGKVILKNINLANLLISAQKIFNITKKGPKADSSAYSNFCNAVAEQARLNPNLDISKYIKAFSYSVRATAINIREIGHSARFYTINLPSMNRVSYEEISIKASEFHAAMGKIISYFTKQVYTVEVKKNEDGTYNIHAHLIAPKPEMDSCLKHVKEFGIFNISMSNRTKDYVNKDGKLKNIKESSKRMAAYIHKPFMTVQSDSKKKKWEKDPLFAINYEIMLKAMENCASNAIDFIKAKASEYAKMFLNAKKLKEIAKPTSYVPEFSYSKEEKIRNILFRIMSRNPLPRAEA